MPSRGALRGRGVRRLPDHDPIRPRLPTRCRHARRRRGGPGLLGSVRMRVDAGPGSSPGWSLLALGFAIKISAAFLLIPLVFGVLRTRRTTGILAACATLLPALAVVRLGRPPRRGGRRLPGIGRQPHHLAGPARPLSPGEPRYLGSWCSGSFHPGVHAAGDVLAMLGLVHCGEAGSYRRPMSHAGSGGLALAASITLAMLAPETASRILFPDPGAGGSRGDRLRTESTGHCQPDRAPAPSSGC